MKRLLIVAISLVAVVLVGSPALAGPQDVANDVASKVMSPFCDGVTLESCPSEEAVRLRSTIADKAASGWSEARIMSWLKTEYGVEAAAPSGSGVGLLAWLLPALAVLTGAVLMTVLLRRWTMRRASESSEAVAPSPGDRARLDRELAQARRRA